MIHIKSNDFARSDMAHNLDRNKNFVLAGVWPSKQLLSLAVFANSAAASAEQCFTPANAWVNMDLETARTLATDILALCDHAEHHAADAERAEYERLKAKFEGSES